jgi:hypothetical protein
MAEVFEDFSLYLPTARVTCKDMPRAQTQIKIDLRERIFSYIEKIDHSFALANYQYIMKNVSD